MLWVLNPIESCSRLLVSFCEVAVGVGACRSEQSYTPPLGTMDLHSSQHTLLHGVHLSGFCLGRAEIARNDVYHNHLVYIPPRVLARFGCAIASMVAFRPANTPLVVRSQSELSAESTAWCRKYGAYLRHGLNIFWFPQDSTYLFEYWPVLAER